MTIEEGIEKRMWLSSGNKPIAIKDMKVSHIKNTMSFIKRNTGREGYLPIFEQELVRRGREAASKFRVTRKYIDI